MSDEAQRSSVDLAATATSVKTPPQETRAEASAATPPLPDAARRALAEAAERREKAKALNLAPELGGRDGPEPVRYGDWEKKGLAVDF